MSNRWAEIASKMDALNEYDREPVPPEKFQNASRFAAFFAGENIAATEFVIGALLIAKGVSAWDMFVGLFIGNALAVMTWAVVCAPIATRTRLSLYWYLKDIIGSALTSVYNVVSALLSFIFAGAMIGVTANAVAFILGIPGSSPTDVYAPNLQWVLIAIVVGLCITLVATLGFAQMGKFAEMVTPWLLVVFIAGGISLLPVLGVKFDFSNFWEIANTTIWTGEPIAGGEKWGFWHVVFFSWLANSTQHLGLIEMAVLRFAPNWKYGFLTATGMFVGHYLAWISSGIMVAAVRLTSPENMSNAGYMASAAIGFIGALAVLLAGWACSNPTLYRGGLALQCATPNWARWKLTFVAGLIATALACFPVFFNKIDKFVGFNGLVLMPIGAIVFAEHWILPKLGLQQYLARKMSWLFNARALAVWLAVVLFVMWQVDFDPNAFIFFHIFPAFVAVVILYTAVQWVMQKAFKSEEIPSAAAENQKA